jgi:hypothetical protein
MRTRTSAQSKVPVGAIKYDTGSLEPLARLTDQQSSHHLWRPHTHATDRVPTVDGVHYRTANRCDDGGVTKSSPRFYHERIFISRRSRYAPLRAADRFTNTRIALRTVALLSVSAQGQGKATVDRRGRACRLVHETPESTVVLESP